MQTSEIRAALSISSLFSLRMIGLFIVLPIFSSYAKQLPGATPFLMGAAFGVYGFTQALFQLPLGSLSDIYPRKNIIAAGFLIFIIGSFICAYSHSIVSMIIGRALQGMGAIGSSLTALLTDLVRPEMRSRAMAMMGAMIAMSFFIAMILGPLLNPHIGVSGIFFMTALLGVFAILLLFVFVPSAPKLQKQILNSQNFLSIFKYLMNHSQLFTLNAGIFCLHVMLTATFVVIPLWISGWTVYALPLLIAFVLTFVLIGFAEKNKKVFSLYFIALTGLILAELFLYFSHVFYLNHLWVLEFSLTLFFLTFCLLEANLPSLVSRLVPIEIKGSAMGLFSTFQFMGIFCGGLLGGVVLQYSSSPAVLLSCALVGFLWFCLTLIIRLLRRESWQEV